MSEEEDCSSESEFSEEGEVSCSDEDTEDEGDEVQEDGVQSGQEEDKMEESVGDSLLGAESSGDEGESCPICLLKLRHQNLGRPEPCQHIFCLTCIRQWAKVTPSCPIDRIEFQQISVREGGGDVETSVEAVKQRRAAERVDIPEEEDAEAEIYCEACRAGDRANLLLLCDSCDLGYHTTCLTPVLPEIPRGAWYCPTCTGVGVGATHPLEENRPFPALATRNPRSRAGSRRRGRPGGNIIPRTSQLESIRRTVDQARRELEHRIGARAGVRKRKTRKRKTGTSKKARTKASSTGNSSKTKSGRKKRKPRRKRRTKKKCGPRSTYRARHQDMAVMESVRQALGLPEPDVHWSREVREGLSITGRTDDLDYFSDESPEEEVSGFSSSSGLLSRVLPRHVAVERLNMARRRRVKAGIELTSIASGPADLLGGILSSQNSLLSKPNTATPLSSKPNPAPPLLKKDKNENLLTSGRLDVRMGGPRVTSTPVNSTQRTGYPVNGGYSGNSSSFSGRSSGFGSAGFGGPSGAGFGASSLAGFGSGGASSASGFGTSGGGGAVVDEDLDLYGNLEEGDVVDPVGPGLPPPRDTDSRLDKSADLYDPEDIEDLSEDEENLVIDDNKPDDIPLPTLQENIMDDIPLPPQKIKIQLKSSNRILNTSPRAPLAATPRAHLNISPQTPLAAEPLPKKKALLADIFGSDDEADMRRTGAHAEEGEDEVQPEHPRGSQVEEESQSGENGIVKEEEHIEEKQEEKSAATGTSSREINIESADREELKDDTKGSNRKRQDSDHRKDSRDRDDRKDRHKEERDRGTVDRRSRDEDRRRPRNDSRTSRDRRRSRDNNHPGEDRARNKDEKERKRDKEVEKDKKKDKDEGKEKGRKTIKKESKNESDRSRSRDRKEKIDGKGPSRANIEDNKESSNEKSGPSQGEKEKNSLKELSDVSDKEMEETREVRLRDPSMSPIESDQSESFEKAATLEGLNPENISPEEDFTSLSEEEEGEIKNYERRKQLNRKKRELQRKVRELERQVIEISPSGNALETLNLILEEGEIGEESKKKKKKLKEKIKKKTEKKKKIIKKKTKVKEAEKKEEVAEVGNDEPKTEDAVKDKGKKEKMFKGRTYRGKSSTPLMDEKEEEEEEEEGDEGDAENKDGGEKKKDKSKRPELARYDVRRVLDAKKEKKTKGKDKNGKKKDNDIPEENSEEERDEAQDAFGRDVAEKKKIKSKRKASSLDRGRKKKKARSRSPTPSLSSSSSSVSSSRSRSRSRKRKKTSSVKRKKSPVRKGSKKTELKKSDLNKKQLPLSDKIKKKVRSRSRDDKKRKRSGSRSRSRSRRKQETRWRRGRSSSRNKRRRRSGSRKPRRRESKDGRGSKNTRRSKSKEKRSASRSRSARRKNSQSRSVSRAEKGRGDTEKHGKLIENQAGEKSVYSSGDKIMVSVNFGDKNLEQSKKIPKLRQIQAKPSVIIDILDDEGPYRIIEPPTELVDIASDNEDGEENLVLRPQLREDTVSNQTESQEDSRPMEVLGPKTPPNEPETEHEEEGQTAPVSNDPKPEPTPVKGPMTPPEPDSYDPFEPTDSPPECELAPSTPPLQPQTPPMSSPPEPRRPPSPPPNSIPFLSSPVSGAGPSTPEPPKIQPYARKPLYTSLPANVSATLPDTNRSLNMSSGSPVDMDLDSPFSPGSGSDLSDLFEPPAVTPPTLPSSSLPRSTSKPSDSSQWAKIIGEEKKQRRPHNNKHKGSSRGKKTVNTRVVDDRLKIIDEVPSSAVEMSVKEKFLKKVQRQERVVEEVKLVLKPAYNARKINKDDYKEILRKTVPKICHSKYGEINPAKIAKLVNGYVKKYQHTKKKLKPSKNHSF